MHLSTLPDATLLKRCERLVAFDRRVTAQLLAHLAEVDARRLYAPAGFPSMFAYCVRKLRFSEDAAAKRIQAARAARRFPELFVMLTDGRMNPSAICLLAPQLSTANAQDLIAKAAGRTRWQIERMLAENFPAAEVLNLEGPIVEIAPAPAPPPAPAPVAIRPAQHAPGHVVNPVKPLSLRRFEIRFSVGEETRVKYVRAQDLTGSRDPERLFDHALDALIGKVEKSKYAVTDHPRAPGETNTARGIPAYVKRGVYGRDGGRCTYRSRDGVRCAARRQLEFDHVVPVAQGGPSTLENLRLRCRTHNQLEADRSFGPEYMARRRSGG